MSATTDVYAAIANPARREILDLLAEGERPVGEIVEAMPYLTQPAVSRHLRVLRESELVESRVAAQQRIYSLRPESLREIDRWISRYRRFWPDKLDALSDHLDRTRGADCDEDERGRHSEDQHP